MYDTQRDVTERDFRMPQFRDARPEEYEFRGDDPIPVRKDRWERGMRRIVCLMGISGDWEIADVVERVERLRKPSADLEAIERDATYLRKNLKALMQAVGNAYETDQAFAKHWDRIMKRANLDTMVLEYMAETADHLHETARSALVDPTDATLMACMI